MYISERVRILTYPVLSCVPRTKKVTEMQALIQATPVPAAVADRLVRKIVHAWVFRSDEKLPGDFRRSSSSSSRQFGGGTTANVGSGSVSTTDSSLPMLRQQSSVASL